MELPEDYDSLESLYQDSPKRIFGNSRIFVRHGKESYIFETDGNTIQACKYYPEYQKFGIMFNETDHHGLFDALEEMNTPQLIRTMEKFESSNVTYFWTFVKERLGRIWKTEKERKKEAEILEHLSKLGDL